MELRQLTEGENGSGASWLVRLDRGEEVLTTLTGLCRDRGIAAASLSGIGAVTDAELGYYDLAQFSYLTRSLEGIWELVSLTGNVALVDGEPFVHAHVSLGNRNLELLGGHLVKATVAVTVELFLNTYEPALVRSFDPEVKLNLLGP